MSETNEINIHLVGMFNLNAPDLLGGKGSGKRAFMNAYIDEYIVDHYMGRPRGILF